MRLIDLNTVLEEIEDTITSVSFCGTVEAARSAHETKDRILSRVKDLPTIDAVPVVHGQWIGKRYNLKTYETETVPYNPLSFEDLNDLTCSICGAPALLNGHEEEVPSNYCPRCGAKMDLEETK